MLKNKKLQQFFAGVKVLFKKFKSTPLFSIKGRNVYCFDLVIWLVVVVIFGLITKTLINEFRKKASPPPPKVKVVEVKPVPKEKWTYIESFSTDSQYIKPTGDSETDNILRPVTVKPTAQQKQILGAIKQSLGKDSAVSLEEINNYIGEPVPDLAIGPIAENGTLITANAEIDGYHCGLWLDEEKVIEAYEKVNKSKLYRGFGDIHSINGIYTIRTYKLLDNYLRNKLKKDYSITCKPFYKEVETSYPTETESSVAKSLEKVNKASGNTSSAIGTAVAVAGTAAVAKTVADKTKTAANKTVASKSTSNNSKTSSTNQQNKTSTSANNNKNSTKSSTKNNNKSNSNSSKSNSSSSPAKSNSNNSKSTPAKPTTTKPTTTKPTTKPTTTKPATKPTTKPTNSKPSSTPTNKKPTSTKKPATPTSTKKTN